MIRKILIANRGEIACRIIRTARNMNIKTVAIYSEIDKNALHATLADEAYCVGSATVKESYLNIESIIHVLKESKADAVHPGYGFLSENVSFAKAVNGAGATFIGPSPQIISDMGDKLRAKELAYAAGVPLVPGSQHPITAAKEVEDFSRSHGFPILLKAAAGGGGRGMRVVRTAEDIDEALARTQNEALSGFGDDRVFIEKYIERPRHIEVQILGDKHGTILHLGMRDCSLQRRHQKVIEEAPVPELPPELLDKISNEALKIARHIGYYSAGTVEFVVTPDHRFYFLEVNTRLQVEHPVTEQIYNLDLVELMIRIANDEKLPILQEDLKIRGHAIEARIYAEDADNGFLPSSGRLTQYHHPRPGNGLRIDSGVRKGDEISIHYDPMIAKVIVHASDRQEAINLMQRYLGQFIIEGVDSNLNYLQRLLADPDVRTGKLNTNLLQEKTETLSGTGVSFALLPTPKQTEIACVALALKLAKEPGLQHEKHWVCATSRGALKLTHAGPSQVLIEGKRYHTQIKWLHQRSLFIAYVNNQEVIGKVHTRGGRYHLTIQGAQFDFLVERESVWHYLNQIPRSHRDNNVNLICSPMPGVLLSLHVGAGDEVRRGQPIAVIEAMKMENTLKSPADGIIAEVPVSPGISLSKAQLIARLA